jgi:hypothetical protein
MQNDWVRLHFTQPVYWVEDYQSMYLIGQAKQIELNTFHEPLKPFSILLLSLIHKPE